MSVNTITIPADPRNGKPRISNAMKAACIGEWEITFDAPYFDENGVLHSDHRRTIDVPWDLCKRIYQRMAEVAAAELSETHAPHQ